jgi:hypothetical protein
MGAEAFFKATTRCAEAKDFGPLRGLTCRSNNPACTGTFEDDARSCTDTYLHCCCTGARASGSARGTNKTWACPTRAGSRLAVHPIGGVKEGLQCPNFGNGIR